MQRGYRLSKFRKEGTDMDMRRGTTVCVSGTQTKNHVLFKGQTPPKIIQPDNPCKMRKALSYKSIL
jgi:hypothetical protein